MNYIIDCTVYGATGVIAKGKVKINKPDKVSAQLAVQKSMLERYPHLLRTVIHSCTPSGGLENIFGDIFK